MVLRSKHFLALFSSALILGLMLFISCADRSVDEDQNPDDLSATTDDLKASGDLQSEKPGGESGGDVPGGPSSAEAKEEAPTAEAPNDEKLAEAPAEDKKADDKAAAELETAVDPSNKAVDDTIASLESKTEEPAKKEDDAKLDSKLDEAIAPPSESPAAESPDKAATAEPPVSPGFDTPAPQPKKSAGKHRGHRNKVAHGDSTPLGKVPQIPGRAFTRGNQLLNRFYFVRQGDTADKVANLIYGDASRGKDLKAWNKPAGKWAAGSLIYYNAPNDPNDTSMKSFYQERNVPFEEYALSEGDTLPIIAKSRLGSRNSWKELAVINGIDSPRRVVKGKKIALYPADLTPYNASAIAPAKTNTADLGGRNASPPNQVAATTPAKSPLNPPPPLENEPKPPGEETPGTKMAKKPAGGLDIGKMVEQNMFFFGVGGMVILLLACLAIFGRKKKSSSGDDFSDELGTSKARRK